MGPALAGEARRRRSGALRARPTAKAAHAAWRLHGRSHRPRRTWGSCDLLLIRQLNAHGTGHLAVAHGSTWASGEDLGCWVTAAAGSWEPGLWQPVAAAAAEGAGPGVDAQSTPPTVAGRRGLDQALSGPNIYGTPSTCDTGSTGRRLYGRATGAAGEDAGEGGEAGSSGAEEEAEAGSAGGGVTAGLQALCCDTRTTSPPPGELEAVGRGGLVSWGRSGQGGVVVPGPGEVQQELAGGVGKDMAVDSPGEGLTTGAAASAGLGARGAGGEAGMREVERRPATLPPRAPTPCEVVDLCSPLPLSMRLGARRGATADCPAGAPAGSGHRRYVSRVREDRRRARWQARQCTRAGARAPQEAPQP